MAYLQGAKVTADLSPLPLPLFLKQIAVGVAVVLAVIYPADATVKNLACESCYGEAGVCICNTSTAVILWDITLSNGTNHTIEFHAGSMNTTIWRNFTAEYYSSSKSSILRFSTTSSENDRAIVTCKNGGLGGNETRTLNITGPPNAPTQLGVEFIANTVRLSWEDTSNCTITYNITLRSNGIRYWFGPTKDDYWQLDVNDLSTERNYVFSVIAIDAGRREAESNTSKPFSITPPIFKCNASFNSDGTILVTWMENSGEGVLRPDATSHIIHNFTADGNTASIRISNNDPTTLNLTNTTCTSGQSYYIRILTNNTLNQNRAYSCDMQMDGCPTPERPTVNVVAIAISVVVAAIAAIAAIVTVAAIVAVLLWHVSHPKKKKDEGDTMEYKKDDVGTVVSNYVKRRE